MLLSEVFQQLTYGELKQVSIGGAKYGGIQVEDYPEIISQVNLAMAALYVRFPISEKELTLQQFDDITIYDLDSKYSVSADDVTVTEKYIIDTVDKPFLDDIVRIEGVYDELGVRLPLNDEDNDKSVFLPSYDSVQIPYPVSTNTLFVVYRAGHVNIDPLTTDPSTVELELPSILLEALLAYVASRIHSGRGSESGTAESINQLSRYDLQCSLVEKKNLLRADSSIASTRLDDNGWA